MSAVDFTKNPKPAAEFKIPAAAMKALEEFAGKLGITAGELAGLILTQYVIPPAKDAPIVLMCWPLYGRQL